MAEPLVFKSVEFHGHDSVEPSGEKSYTVRRKASQDLLFKAELNRPEPHLGWSLEFYTSGSQYKDFWIPGSWHGLACPPGESDVWISAVNKHLPDGVVRLGVSVKVITEDLTPEEKEACTHPTTRTCEGEYWGGASGSCTVEIITLCAVCGAYLSRSYDHRD